MPKRLYLVPIVTVLRLPYNRMTRVPKYAHNIPADWAMMDFGLEDTALVAVDVTAAQHAQMSQSDVVVFPTDLDQPMLGNMQGIVVPLEDLNLPANAFNANDTYRDVLQVVTGSIQVAQRVKGIQKRAGRPRDERRLFPPGVGLSTELHNLPPGLQVALLQAGRELGINQVPGPTVMLREVLQMFSQQLPPAKLLGVAI